MLVIIFGASGEIGKIFVEAFKKQGIAVLAVEKNDDAALWIDKIPQAQMVILAVPIEATPALAQKVAPFLRADQIFSDFTSVKENVIAAMQKSSASVISAHPMFGTVKNIQGQKMLLLPVRCQKQQLADLEKLYQSLGLDVYILKQWQKHDSYMSVIQALLHFTQISLATTLREHNVDIQTLLDICSPIYQINFSLVCRILMRNPELYTHILIDNPHNLEFLETFLAAAKKQVEQIKQKKKQEFLADFKQTSIFLKKSSKAMTELETLGNILLDKVQETNSSLELAELKQN